MHKIAPRRAVAPDTKGILPGDDTVNQRGHDHGVVETEIVVWPIYVGRAHDGDLVPAVFDPVGIGLELAHTLGPRREPVVRRGEAGPDVVFAKSLRGSIDGD